MRVVTTYNTYIYIGGLNQAKLETVYNLSYRGDAADASQPVSVTFLVETRDIFDYNLWAYRKLCKYRSNINHGRTYIELSVVMPEKIPFSCTRLHNVFLVDIMKLLCFLDITFLCFVLFFNFLRERHHIMLVSWRSYFGCALVYLEYNIVYVWVKLGLVCALRILLLSCIFVRYTCSSSLCFYLHDQGSRTTFTNEQRYENAWIHHDKSYVVYRLFACLYEVGGMLV